MLEQSDRGRIARLIPIRHGRMVRTPFTFYRGAALNMAADLAATPATGLRVQACGDCHLYNFGAYATPERRIVFDINDLDETLPAPWEWDVKRLATSFVLASLENGLSRGDANDAALSCVRSYRERMAEYSDMTILEVWYASIDIEKMITGIDDAETRRRDLRRLAAGAREQHVGTPLSKSRDPRRSVADHPGQSAADLPPASSGKTRSTFSSGSLLPTTGNHCRKIDVRFSTALILRMPRSRWSGSVVSARGAASCS